MNFKYNAFIENTSEMREFMESMGYRQIRLASAGGNVICTLSDGWYDIKNSTTGRDMFNAYLELFKPIDCTSNPELFKAVTAIRDDSDYMQWFIDSETWYLCESILFSNCSLFDKEYSTQIKDGSYFHKATLEELIKHFKK